MKFVLQGVLRRPRLIAEQAITYLALGVVAYWWLGLPVGRIWQVAALAVTGLLWILALFLSARRAIRQLRCEVPWLPPFQRALTGAALALLGIGCMYVLLGWVPAFQSLTAQLLSLAVRFGIGYLVLVGCWLTVAALISGGIPRPEQTPHSAP